MKYARGRGQASSLVQKPLLADFEARTGGTASKVAAVLDRRRATAVQHF